MTNTMTFTIEEILEAKDRTYLTLEMCSGCELRFTELAPIDPGAEYHAFVLPTCKTCTAALGGPLLDTPTEDEYQTILEAHNFFHPTGPVIFDDKYEDYVDLNQEKWDNYYNDYNQCGVHVSY